MIPVMLFLAMLASLWVVGFIAPTTTGGTWLLSVITIALVMGVGLGVQALLRRRP